MLSETLPARALHLAECSDYPAEVRLLASERSLLPLPDYESASGQKW
jgi:hypothetical protein